MYNWIGLHRKFGWCFFQHAGRLAYRRKGKEEAVLPSEKEQYPVCWGNQLELLLCGCMPPHQPEYCLFLQNIINKLIIILFQTCENKTLNYCVHNFVVTVIWMSHGQNWGLWAHTDLDFSQLFFGGGFCCLFLFSLVCVLYIWWKTLIKKYLKKIIKWTYPSQPVKTSLSMF